MSTQDAVGSKELTAEADDRPNGPVFASVIGAAVGTFVLGLFTTLAEASAKLKDWLNWRNPVGPLSGKTSLGLAAWVGAWLVLGFVWRRRDIDERKAIIVSAILIGLGVLGTFPSFFERFTAE